MENITFAQLIGAAAVVLALVAAYNTVSTALKNRREQNAVKNAPFAELRETVQKHGEMLGVDKRRLDRLEADMDRHASDSEVIMKMLLALTRHAIDGNNIEDLKHQRDCVQDYLVESRRG